MLDDIFDWTASYYSDATFTGFYRKNCRYVCLVCVSGKISNGNFYFPKITIFSAFLESGYPPLNPPLKKYIEKGGIVFSYDCWMP